jgi:hypothetical protein
MNDNERLDSKTYKLRAPQISDYAIYFTIVGEGTPVAFFVNSKEMKSFQWVTALMTSYSRQLKQGTPIEEVIHDMHETFDPAGKYVIPDGSGREVNSLVHHLGLILEQHVNAA